MFLSLPRDHGEGGPRKRWKGHKEKTVPNVRQSPYFFARAPKNMPASSYCGAITILPLWSM